MNFYIILGESYFLKFSKLFGSSPVCKKYINGEVATLPGVNALVVWTVRNFHPSLV
jgi:hypothetical protein